jgi:hypothetical protein
MNFYLPLMEYELKFLFADFLFFFRLFMKNKAIKVKFWLPKSFKLTWCTSYSEFWKLETLGYLPYKFRLRKVKPWSFYFPHLKYGKYWFHLQNKKKLLQIFMFWDFLYLKNKFKAKKIPSVTRPCRGFLDEIWGAAGSAVLGARKLKFWLQASFKPTWCTSYSEFWNLEIPLKTQESNKFNISFGNFQNC